MRRDVLVRRRSPGHPPRLRIHVIVPLRRPLDAVGPVQAGVEPLRAVGRRHLGGEHVAVLVVESPGVVLAAEVAAFPAPVGPAAGQSAEDLAGVGLLAGAGVARGGPASLEPLRHPSLRHPFQLGRDPGPAEVLLGQNIHRHLRPVLRCTQILHLEDGGAVRVDDPRGAGNEGKGGERISPLHRVLTGDLHGSLPGLW